MSSDWELASRHAKCPAPMQRPSLPAPTGVIFTIVGRAETLAELFRLGRIRQVERDRALIEDM